MYAECDRCGHVHKLNETLYTSKDDRRECNNCGYFVFWLYGVDVP